MKPIRHSLLTNDGTTITIYRHEPSKSAHANLVIAPAMAVPQSFYANFSAFMARQGYRVWTFDYRGVGESLQGPLRACKADISDWIKHDFESVVQHAGATAPDAPLFVLGHSLGGQTTPLLPSAHRINGLVNIAVGSGSPRHTLPKLKRSAPFLWYVLAPVLCPLFGYFPGAKLGLLGNIPRRVMFQWRRWCLTPDYLLTGEPGARTAYADARYPVLGITFADDELLLESGSRMLHEAYTSATVNYRVLSPQQFDLERVGHFGFFRAEHETVLWPLVQEWLDLRCTVK